MSKWDEKPFCADAKALYKGYKLPEFSNKFLLVATVLEDQDYAIPDANWRLPIAFSFGCVTTRGEMAVDADASLPPGPCLQEGEQIQIEGVLREDDGDIYPVATAITRCDDEEQE
jgi:hypothetical protein